MSGDRDTAELSLMEAFNAMRVFVFRFWDRGDRKSEELRNLLSWSALARVGDTDEIGTADPAQWGDWLAAVDLMHRGETPERLMSGHEGDASSATARHQE